MRDVTHQGDTSLRLLGPGGTEREIVLQFRFSRAGGKFLLEEVCEKVNATPTYISLPTGFVRQILGEEVFRRCLHEAEQAARAA